MELFAGLYRRPYKPTEHSELLRELIGREGPLNIEAMKRMTGLLVKQITPALHRLQEAFLVFEDQFDGEWDRGWYLFDESSRMWTRRASPAPKPCCGCCRGLRTGRCT